MNDFRMARCLTTIALLASVVGPVAAQVERSELGKRLQRFEVQWQRATEPSRIASTEPMQQAVRNFFSLRWQQAIARLDEAWYAAADRQASPWESAVIAHRLAIQPFLVTGDSTELNVSLQATYPIAPADQIDGQVRWSISRAPRVRTAALRALGRPKDDRNTDDRNTDAEGSDSIAGDLPELTFVQDSSWREAIEGVTLPIGELPPGDYLVHARVIHGDQHGDLLPSGWSRIDRFAQRVQTIRDAADDHQRDMADWLRATLADHGRLLWQIGDGRLHEIDYPADQILRLCEAALQNPGQAGPLFLERAASEDLWMTVVRERRTVSLRIRCPPVSDARPLPVLLLFHGAGGSENMFFETYGSGGAVDAGLKRGWLVVATRQAWTGLGLDAAQLLDCLEAIFPIDRSKVLMLGHSMGAGQVANQVSLQPDLPLAVAALGGGGRIRNVQAAAQVPWFIAAGSLDFGKTGALALSQNLKQAGGRRIEYREYPHVEHMVIVQAALPDVFRFFDDVVQTEEAE
jgi:predicted esterase